MYLRQVDRLGSKRMPHNKDPSYLGNSNLHRRSRTQICLLYHRKLNHPQNQVQDMFYFQICYYVQGVPM